MAMVAGSGTTLMLPPVMLSIVTELPSASDKLVTAGSVENVTW